MKFLTLLDGAANASQSFSEYFVLSKKSTFHIPLTLPSEENPNRDPDLFGKLDPYIYLDTNYNLEARRILAEQSNPQSQLHKAISIIKAANKKKAKYEDAVIILKELHENDPESFEINYQIGYAYSRLKNTKEAEEYFSKALEKEPNHLLANYELANLYLKNKNYLEALDHYNQVLDILKDGINDRQSWIKVMIANDIKYLAKNLQEIGERDLALNLVERVFEMDGKLDGKQVFNLDKIQKLKNSFISLKANEVKYLVGEGKYEEALRFYENLRKELNIQTEFSEIVTDELRSLVQKRNYNEAVEFYQHVRNLKLSKSNPLEYLYGFSLFQKGDSENAIEVLSKLVGTEVDDAVLNYNLGRAFEKLEMFDEAKKYYKIAATEREPNHIVSTYNLARLYLAEEQPNYTEAYQLLLKATQIIDEGMTEHVNNRGSLLHVAKMIAHPISQLYRAGRYEEAKYLADRMISVKSGLSKPLFDKSNELFVIKRAVEKKLLERTGQNFQEALTSKEHFAVYENMQVLINQQKYKKAAPLYDSLSDNINFQNDEDFLYQGGLIMKNIIPARDAEAIENFRKAYLMRPDKAEFSHQLGTTMLRFNSSMIVEGGSATDYLVEARLLNPTNVFINADLADHCLRDIKDYHTAHQCYSQILEQAHIDLARNQTMTQDGVSYANIVGRIGNQLDTFYFAGQYDMAADLAEGLMQIDPRLHERASIIREKAMYGYLAAANSDFDRKDFEKVVKHLEKPKNKELIDYKAGILAQKMDQDELALKFYKREIANYGSKHNGARSSDNKNALLAPSRVLAKMRRYEEAMKELQSLPSTLDESKKKEMTDWLIGTIAVKGTPRETERLAERYPLSAKLQKEWQDVKSTIPETIPEQPKSWFSAITEFLWPSSSPKNPEVRHLRTDKSTQNKIL